jgi:hypothetical protein
MRFGLDANKQAKFDMGGCGMVGYGDSYWDPGSGTERSRITPPQINLRKAAARFRGIDDKFATNPISSIGSPSGSAGPRPRAA